jgi:hypothetical protein
MENSMHQILHGLRRYFVAARRSARASVKQLQVVSALLVCLVAPPSLSAKADDNRDCAGVGGVSSEATAGAAKIRVELKRVHFLRNGSERAGCPKASPACEALSFVTSGDFVLVGRQFENFTCALIVASGGRKTQGWLPSAALEAATPAHFHNWYGFWVVWGGIPRITIQHVDDVVVKISAELYGTVMFGTVKPQGDRLDFAVNADGKPVPITEGGDKSCRMHLRIVGPYLLVEDEDSCGTARFSGIYVNS